MTQTEASHSRVIPGFSCLQMKQELQERRRRETEGMTDEEVREYIRKGAESFDREMERLRTEKAKKSEPVMT